MSNKLPIKDKIISKNETKKVNYTNIFVIAFFLIALIYLIFIIIKNSFTPQTIFYRNNLKQYTSDENLLVSNYFYQIDLQVANFLEAVDREMYSELYDILDENYKKVYSKKQIESILKKYRNEIFIYDEKKSYTEHLINVYKIDDRKYLAQLDFDNGNFYVILSNGRKGYNFILVE